MSESELTPVQQSVLRVVRKWLERTGQSTMPTAELAEALEMEPGQLQPVLTSLAEMHLDVREDKPNSPGWVALDQISGSGIEDDGVGVDASEEGATR